MAEGLVDSVGWSDGMDDGVWEGCVDTVGVEEGALDGLWEGIELGDSDG